MAPASRAAGTPHRRGAPRDLLLAATLVAAVCVAYLPALGGGRLLDDELHITAPQLQSLGGLWRIWFVLGATQQYYPVLHTAFWVEHRLWGDAVTGYHLANVVQHAGAALLVAALMRRLRLPGAWLGAFLFALHPVCVESVAWIAEQKNTLSTVFALGAALAYLEFDEDRRGSRFWLSLGLFTLALLSKTSVVTLPAALLVVIWWRRSRLGWRRDIVPMLPWFALGAVVSLATLAVEHRLLADVRGNFALSPVERGLLAGRIFWFYLAKLAFPVGLTFFYPRWPVDAGASWQYLYPLAVVAVAGGLWAFARRNRGPLAAFLCYGLLLFPVLGFFNLEWFVFSFVADHLQYVASVAVLMPLAAVVSAGALRLPEAARRAAPAATGLALAALGVMTWRQCGRYADPVLFYRTAAAMNPAAAVAHNHLGVALALVPGHDAEAVSEFEEALRTNPNVAEGQENLGSVLLRDPGRRAEAVAHLEKARDLRPDRKPTRDKLAIALAGLPGHRDGAIAEYQASLRIDPTDPFIHESLGLLLAEDPSRRAEAREQFEMALRLKDRDAPAHFYLAQLLAQEPDHVSEAVFEYETGLRIDPQAADAHYALGNLLMRVPGRSAEALDHFAQAVRIRPGFAEAQNNLGSILMDMPGRMPEAIAAFEAALQARPEFAGAENNLGIALGSTPGRLPEAIAHFEAAVRIDPGFAEAKANLASARQYLEQMRGAPR